MAKKPVLREANFLSNAISQIQQSKILVLLQFATIAGLIFVMYALTQQKKIITIIDQDGKTFSTSSSSMNSEVLEKQVRYYSRDMIEKYFDLDYRSVVANRSSTKDVMADALREKSFADEKNSIVANKSVYDAINQKYICTYEWLIMPWVSSVNYPYYTVFGQVKRIIKKEGFKPFEEIKNVKLTWKHMKDRPDPFKYPHDLILGTIDEVDTEDKEYREAINKR